MQWLKQSQSSEGSHGWGKENALCVGIAGMAVREKSEVKIAEV